MLHKFNWFGLRWGALIIIGALLIDIEFLILNISFCLFHINLGLKTIVRDYIHTERIRVMSSSAIKICYIELIRCAVELFV
uniref:Succinate:cytochrome c oxidoreductase subunit 4 n=1 Tax=Gelidium arborescens TaxID=1911538 RepID=A0A1D8X7A1_9FLOR|nr:succinate:cytochrome c oxidoreductase subunit 4 [Gelidium arborescens]AOX48907.1 succinate:cytochrome c oxidoreductase subunit 4 [Gelidium arborescens]